MNKDAREQLADDVSANLPYLRRYARALTGSQDSGDTYALATLEAILSDPDQYNGGPDAKVALFRSFHAIWTTSGAVFGNDSDATDLARKARDHLSKLTPNTREALLLHTVEDFSPADVGTIMDVPPEEAQELIDIAYAEMGQNVSGRVMIIEDEAIISMDLETIVADMGHRVTGIARTRDRAVQLAKEESADLILSDIQLADNSSGIDAVNDIIAAQGERPVIFITAFPERLLTGEGPEPAFLISKPYTEAQVKSAVSQAMFFSSTETLKA
ncbi:MULTISPECIES: response regulator [Roseobacteraceae]|uniref:response regulator n=1 Tax=Roseobacteraceae TaxID=2854170 RepID=UPI001C4564F6|nr:MULTISPECIES: response regulator [Roseobacteraceae]MBV7409031.1 response regulator [Maritimibacter sp. DP1N21-5]MBY5934282.1 response regulator [Tateyamaria omphalii]